MSAMGFYPVDPSSPNYVLGSPIFDQVIVHLGNGHDLKIIAKNNSDHNAYIQSATLNGKAWNKTYFSHADIVDGGVLVLNMGRSPIGNGEPLRIPPRHRCPTSAEKQRP